MSDVETDETRSDARTRDARWCLAALAALALLLGLCQNGRWIPAGSDDALYLSMARQLVSAEAAEQIPLKLRAWGWPSVLAGLMWVSPSFWWLNLCLLAMVLTAAGLWFFVLRRFTSAPGAAAVVVLTGLMFEWHRFTFMHYTEALFYALLAGALLLAVQVSERRRAGWRIALLAVLTIAAIVVRWAGLIFAPVLVGAAVRGLGRPSLDRRWVVPALAGLVVCLAAGGAFYGSRALMRARLSAVAAAAPPTATDADTPATQPTTDVTSQPTTTPATTPTTTPTTTAEAPDDAQRQVAAAARRELHRDRRLSRGIARRPASVFLMRISNGGRWMAGLLCPPAMTGKRNPPIRWVANGLGWMLWVLLAVRAIAGAIRRDWLWIGVLVTCGGFLTLWWPPVPRYIAPIAPLILLGLLQGIDGVLRPARSRVRRVAARCVAGVLVAAVLACNGAILAVTIYVHRSPGFPQLCQAGEYGELVAIGRYLREANVRPGELAVSVKYRDINRDDPNRWGARMMFFLTGVESVHAPADGSQAEKAAWASRHGVRFLLARPDELVQRIWHFRRPLFDEVLPGDRTPFYVLYELRGESLSAVNVPPAEHGLRRVPGL